MAIRISFIHFVCGADNIAVYQTLSDCFRSTSLREIATFRSTFLLRYEWYESHKVPFFSVHPLTLSIVTSRVTSSVFWELPTTTRHDTSLNPPQQLKIQTLGHILCAILRENPRLNPSARLKQAQSGLQRQLDLGGTRPGQKTKTANPKKKNNYWTRAKSSIGPRLWLCTPK